MKISVRKAGISELDLLMEWRMQVLAEVFSDYENVDWETLRKNNEDYYKEHLADGTHTACFAMDTEQERIVGCGGICYQKEMPSPIKRSSLGSPKWRCLAPFAKITA